MEQVDAAPILLPAGLPTMLTAAEVACPNCTRSLKLSQPATVGKRLRCPQCGCPFTVTANDLNGPPALPPPPSNATTTTMPRSGIQTPPPLPFAPASFGEGAAPPKRGLLIGGILAGLVLLLGGAAGLAWYFARNETPDSKQAAADPKKEDKPAGEKKDSPTTGSNEERKPDDSEGGEEKPKPSREEAIRPSEYETPRPKPEKEPQREPTAPVALEPVRTRTTLPPEEQARVNKAIDRGVDYLKITQSALGTWNTGHSLGLAALPGLTLLECGVPADDRFVQKAAAFVRTNAPRNHATYEIALAILFLNRLGDKKDEALIRTLGLRLVAGQMMTGGWTYVCPIVDPKFEPGLLLVLERTRPLNPLELFVTGNDGKANLELIGLDPKIKLSPELTITTSKFDPDGPFRGVVEGISKNRPDGTPPTTISRDDPRLEQKEKEKTDATRKALANLPRDLQRIPSLLPPSALKDMPRSDQTDNSNTQFAILGVLAATRHGVPTDRAMGLIVQRFRTSQNSDGTFGYHYNRGGGVGGGHTPSMTGAGLLGLAVTHGLTAGMKMEGMAAKGVQDKHIQKALTALSQFIERPLGKPVGLKGRSPVNLYFLWTVERVGMLYGLAKINDKDWYHWGAELLLDAQQKNGSWMVGMYPGSMSTTDTCFALLFLKRANLAKDLAIKVQSKLELIMEDK